MMIEVIEISATCVTRRQDGSIDEIYSIGGYMRIETIEGD